MKNLMWKEFKIGIQTVGILIILIPIIECIPTLFLSREYFATIKDFEVLRVVATNTIMYFPAMQIPMIGTLMFQSVINEERKQKIISVLLANGIKPKELWRSKILAGICTSYVMSLFGVIIGVLYCRLVYHVWIQVNYKSMMYLLIIFPAISLAFLDLISLVIWTSKKGQFFAGFIPAISYIGCMYLNLFQADIHVKISETFFFCMILLLAGLIFLICDVIAKNMSKEYLSSMEA